MSNFTIRGAAKSDLDRLIELEAHSFESDRLSRRSFRHLLGRGHAVFRVAMRGRGIVGYYILLFRAGSPAGRLYSLAVHQGARGAGFAKALLADAERLARRKRRHVLRLEVREDNLPAIRLYERLGYQPIGRRAHYYADRTHALRYEKHLGARGDIRASDSEEDRSPRDDDALSPQMTGRREAVALRPKTVLVPLRRGARPASEDDAVSAATPRRA